ncbi:transcriptional activator protein DAL81 [Magnaporthiopsis poae ATCC 64411]|uniref:Transcriptional activator protein DAL81 n=1 Tax=Magnaporthiopsis poae (strain ATCC 64411 / 73-15) TaxID=644358 RepID=A0A0C4DZV2_MAGP6|nr:transcriptional activator protein DAL81 [Magnaporthiopsis poae ATCC 64411]
MSTPIAVARTAPIPIAPKPSRQPPSRQGSTILDAYPHSMSGLTSPGSDSPLSGQPAMPCEACLRRRIKCIMSDDDDDSSCISCQANHVGCSLTESPQPRKRKLKGDLEVSHSKRSSPGQSDNRRRRRQHQASLSSTAASSSLIEEMANFGGPTLLKRSLGLQKDRYSQYIGPTTDFEPSLINLSPFDPHDESLLARGTLRKVSENDTFLLLPDQNTPGHEHQTEDVDEIERLVAPHGRRLIDLYFRVVHPSFPILQKTVVYEKYERDCHEISPPLLAAMYILAINWWDHDEELAPLPRPNVRELERLVRVTLADAMYRPKLSTVQAGLLLSQRPEGDQWAPTAQLVAIAQELGLHLDASSWKIPAMQNVTNAGIQGTHLVLSLAKPIQIKLKEWHGALPAAVRMDQSGGGSASSASLASLSAGVGGGNAGRLTSEADWYRRRLGEYRWTLSVSSKPGEGKGLTEFAMGMLDISTGLLKKLPEKPSLSRSGSVADMDGVRCQGLLALGTGVSGRGPPGGVPAASGSSVGGSRMMMDTGLGMGMGLGLGAGSSAFGAFPDMRSVDASGMHSPGGSQSGDADGDGDMEADGDEDGDESSDDESMYGMFPTSGMASMAK